MTKRSWVFHKDPWHPADWDENVVYAIRALFAGNANDGQQRLVLDWLKYACGADDMSFRPGGPEGDRNTTFAEGKRSVWLQFAKMTTEEITAALNLKRQADTNPKKR
jgi:hypothetical protein